MDIDINGKAIAGAILIVSGVFLHTFWLILLGFIVLFLPIIVISIIGLILYVLAHSEFKR